MSWPGSGGHTVSLVTVVQIWGSAPRPPGALLAVREDGVVSGSVSGGCVEDDLIARAKAALAAGAANPVAARKEEAARFGLPCGGTLRLVQEPLHDPAWIETLLARTPAEIVQVKNAVRARVVGAAGCVTA